MNECCENTDKEIWHKADEVFGASIHVTENEGIGIDVGGHVYVKPVRGWHGLAKERDELHLALMQVYDTIPDVDHCVIILEDILNRMDKCEHGRGLTDYCLPCGRTHSA